MNGKSKKYSGLCLTSGLAFEKVFFYKNTFFSEIEDHLEIDVITKENKFLSGYEATLKQLKYMEEQCLKESNKQAADIFYAHSCMLKDKNYTDMIKENYKNKGFGLAKSIRKTCEYFYNQFISLDNEYLKKRADDILDVSKRLLSNVMDTSSANYTSLTEARIIISVELLASELYNMNFNLIKGIVTKTGGSGSHLAILADNLGIPYIIIENEKFFTDIVNDTHVIIDGFSGEITINPSQKDISDFNIKKEEFLKTQSVTLSFNQQYCVTKDGNNINLSLAVEDGKDVSVMENNKLYGVGLYRTEFLYINSTHLLNEEEQFNAYKKVFELCGNKPVCFRTLDIGADKVPTYLSLKEETNPFLGNRGIRLSLNSHRDIFITQIRALLRCSCLGNLKIMLPMICNLQEVLEAKKIIQDTYRRMQFENIQLGNYKLGIMIETPAAVQISDVLIKEVDFFSIGTNDLLSYTLGVDRMNTNVSYLYNTYSLSLIRSIKKVIDICHKYKKHVSICGQSASNTCLVPLYIGLGIDELVMSNNNTLKVKQMLKNKKYTDMKKLANNILNIIRDDDIMMELRRFACS